MLDVIKKHRGNLYFDSLYIICIGAEKIIIKNNA
ncbi:heat-stable enterotoxin ST-IA/ST-P domain protein, partial [Escherichia coli]|nr:heat-stable enterotoxin ST-IA/ST-P domain protein [Escherichia coli]EFD0703453.1 heat-stable enterotoxin ST-IA/ST-P domain protein [Escherichia coli]EFD0751376.1 heat-stable enterotoxin ST-IA/ST-P domain protein [Escherichia coli]